MPRIFAVAALLALAACGDAADAPDAPAAERSADAIADEMLARYEAGLGAVDDFTVVAAGAEARYVAADDTSGLDRFGMPQLSAVGDGEVAPEAQLLLMQVPNVPRLARGLRTAEVEGPVTRDGRSVYMFTTDDPGALVGEPGGVPPDTSATRGFRVYVTADTYDIAEIYQSVSADTLAVTSRLIYSDFRDVDGVRLPFAVRQVETGLNAGISRDEQMIIGGQLGLRIQQLQAAPPSPARDAQLRELASQRRLIGEGIAEAELAVDEVRVGGE